MVLVEIFEFDAMDEPPSMLDVDVYDFDGPFDEATSLGHAEINFVKSNLSELADVLVPLQGKLAQAYQSKLHLRIFLNDTRGSNVVKEYLTKMEKEVGKKVNDNLFSPRNIKDYIIHLSPFTINSFYALNECFVDKIAISSNKFSVSETIQASTRRISYQ